MVAKRPTGGQVATFVESGQVASAAPRNRGVLMLLTGSEVGRIVTIARGTPLTLGRAEECLLCFQDGALSRLHATVMLVGDTFVISDEKSTNGTFVNDAPVRGSQTLAEGDRVRLGQHTLLRFSLVDEAEESAMRQVYENGRNDALTGIGNRKAFEERIRAEVAFARRHDCPLSIALMDLDHFKNVNDTHGHAAGDELLRRVGHLLGAAVRAEDFVARYGGEEFVIIARGVETLGAGLMADRLRIKIAEERIAYEGGVLRATVSVGIASLVCCEEGAGATHLVKRADARLYLAKERGRNRVVADD